MPEKKSDIDEEYPDEDGKCEVGADSYPRLQSMIWIWMASIKKTNTRMKPS